MSLQNDKIICSETLDTNLEFTNLEGAKIQGIDLKKAKLKAKKAV